MKGLNSNDCLPFQIAMGQPPHAVLISGVVNKEAIDLGGFDAVKSTVEAAARQIFKALSEKEFKRWMRVDYGPE